MAEARCLSSSLESSNDSSVSGECLQELLDLFVKNTYRAKTVDRRYEIIHKRCIHLFGRDYELEILDNKQGQLCGHYPSELIVIKGHTGETNSSKTYQSVKTVNNATKLKDLITTARLARCRSRFVMPVILFEGKNICRSATLSTMAELYGRSGVEWIFTGGGNGGGAAGTSQEQVLGSSGATVEGQRSSNVPGPTDGAESTGNDTEWVLLNKVRSQDVQLMKILDVSLICDLMVEKKKLKYGVYVASSEKVDKWARYSDFHIASMPYPGCEFFKDYKDNGYNPVSLTFDWKQTFIDAELSVPQSMEGAVTVPYSSYQGWDLVEITQNYFLMLLKYLLECDGGILIHCISGWDRTPLFISLLRLSLWADDRIHQSLCAAEVLYLTVAYDWLLCGHQLKERHEKGEEVMYFCFDFLKYMIAEEYSVNNRPNRRKTETEFDVKDVRVIQNGFAHDLCTNRSRATSTSTSNCLLSPLSFAENSLSDEDVGKENEMTSCSPHGNESSYLSSLKKVSLDSTNQRCGYSSSSSPSENKSRSYNKDVNLRGQRLNEVRELFIVAYCSSVPETPEPTTGTLAGLFSKLTGSFLSNPTVK